MNDDIIRVNNASYSKYEELLTRKDEVNKLAFQYEREYVREFGDLILAVFQMKLETIRKKKTIEYCQIFAGRGESVDRDALQEYLRKELAEYKEKLDDMIKDNEEAKKCEKITEIELLHIKRIYHRLVKKIHPDINPLTEENEELYGLWQRLIAAYNCNDLKEMEETEILVNSLLEKLNLGVMDITIPDIDEKIAEIEEEINRIISTDPYQYKYLLENADAVSQKKEELRRELKEYEDYGRQLDEILNDLLQKEGVTFTWKMN